MKPTLLIAASLLGTGVALSERHGAPYYSVGDLSAERSAISNVTGPDLAWHIAHPQTIADCVRYDAARGSLRTLSDVRVSARIVGIGKASSVAPYRVGFWTTVGTGGGWQLIFDGTPLTQRATEDVLGQRIAANTDIALAGQAYGLSNWLAPIASSDAPGNVRGFAKGDAVPAVIGTSPVGFLSSYLTPQEGNPGVMEVAIGPKEMLFFFELPSETGDRSKRDFQDLVVLLSFESL